MAKSRKMRSEGSARERVQNRVMVFRVNAPKRPFVSLGRMLMVHRPSDWHPFGIEGCNEEIERRKAIHKLMTEDEREFFDKYCWARDD